MVLNDINSLIINSQKYLKSAPYKLGDTLTPKNINGVHSTTITINNGVINLATTTGSSVNYSPRGYYYLGSIMINGKLYYLATVNGDPNPFISPSDEWQ